MTKKTWVVLAISLLNCGQTFGNAAFDLPQETKTKLMLVMLDNNYPLNNSSGEVSNIDNDLDVLFTNNRINRDAVRRLMEQADKAEAAILERIKNGDIDFTEKKILYGILERSCTPESQKAVIEFSEQMRKLEESARQLSLRLYFGQTFRAFEECGHISSVINYANQLLNNQSADLSTKAQAMYFLANVDARQSEKWLDLYKPEQPYSELTYSILYLGVMAGKASYVEKSSEFLIESAPALEQKYTYESRQLIELLADKMSVSEMSVFLRSLADKRKSFASIEDIKEYRVLSELYNGNDEQKENAVEYLFSLPTLLSKKSSRIVVKSTKNMIRKNEVKPYLSLWNKDDIALTHILKFMGYKIISKDNIASFIADPLQK